MVSTQSAGAKRPSGLAANTVGSSGTLLQRKDCMNSFMRFQPSPGTTQGQYSTWTKHTELKNCHSEENSPPASLTEPSGVCTHLHRDTSDTGAHGDCANFDQKVTVAIPRTPTLHLVSLGVLKMTFELHHEDVKVCVRYQTGSSFKQSQAAEGKFWVVHHIQELGGLTCNTNTTDELLHSEII